MFRGNHGDIIITADPDAKSEEEAQAIDEDMPVLWKPTVEAPADDSARAPEKNAHHYSPAEQALIRSRGAPCLTCNCSEMDRAHCEAW